MSNKLVWNKTGERFYETGVENGVLYPRSDQGAYPLGVAWNGLITVTENPTGAEPTPLYADNIKYLNLVSKEEFQASIEAYTYPDEFAECDGSAEIVPGIFAGQQSRKTFGMAYKTTIGDDVVGNDRGYKLHLIYGALAAPSDKAYSTINDSPDAITFSWEVTTTPVPVPGFKETASLVIDSRKTKAEDLAKLEEILFGGETAARLPMPAEIIELIGVDALG